MSRGSTSHSKPARTLDTKSPNNLTLTGLQSNGLTTRNSLPLLPSFVVKDSRQLNLYGRRTYISVTLAWNAFEPCPNTLETLCGENLELFLFRTVIMYLSYTNCIIISSTHLSAKRFCAKGKGGIEKKTHVYPESTILLRKAKICLLF